MARAGSGLVRRALVIDYTEFNKQPVVERTR